MSIASADILIKGSTTNGAAGNVTANGGAGTNLGKYATTGSQTDNVLNNLFPDITGDENAQSNADYQCVFIHNNHATLAYQNAVAFISSEVAGGASCSIGVDTTAASAVGSAAAQAVSIAGKNAAPAGIAFSAPTTKGTGLSIGTLNAGQVRGLWVKRQAANSAAVSNDGVTLQVEGDSL